MACKLKHKESDLIVKDLPINQGGVGRHKCASCAYEKGLENGKKHLDLKKDEIESFIQKLPLSQKGLRRHRDPVEAYELGFYHGQVEASKYLTINDKKGISFSMRNFGLSLVSKGILNVIKEDNLPYEHALGVINVAHGFEILLKARIVEQHPLLIFEKSLNNEKIKKGKELEFQDLLDNGRTIDYSKLPYQLWAVTGYELKDVKLFKDFGLIRNQIIHFHAPLTLSLSDLTFKYSFILIEKAVNDWWDKSILDYIKVFDRDAYKDIFKKLNKLDIKMSYKYDKRKGFKKIK